MIFVRLIALLIVMAACHNMHGVTVFGYSFEVPLMSRISALYNTAYTYMVANHQESIEQAVVDRQPANIRLNDQAAQRAARILGHIAPEDHSPVTPVSCNSSSVQRASRTLGHIAPEGSLHNSTNVYPAVTNGAYTQPLHDRQLNQDMQNVHNRPTKRMSRILGHIAPESNAKLTSIVAQPAAGHIDSTIAVMNALRNFERTDSSVLIKIMECHPGIAKAFAERAEEHFVQTDWRVLTTIMKYYPEAEQVFVKLAPLKIIERRPESAQTFAELAVEDFMQADRRVLIKIMECYPEAAKTFAKLAVENFTKTDERILIKIMACCPKAAQAFIDPAIENFKEVSPFVLGEIMDCCPESAKLFVKPAADHLCLMQQNWGYNSLLSKIMEYCPEAAQIFAKVALDNIIHIDKYIWQNIVKRYPEAKSDSLALVKWYLPYIFDAPHMTQTQQLARVHDIEMYQCLSGEGYVNYQYHPALQAMTRYVIELEHQEQQKGRYTFVHGHHWQYHFAQEVYTDLWKIMHGPVNNFLFLRYQNHVYPCRCGKETRERLMKHSDNWELFENYMKLDYQQNLLFMNYALFCNFETPFCNTGYYIKENVSENPITIDCNAFMKDLRLDHYLTMNELGYIYKRLKGLEQEHAAISEYGNGVLLSFTPEMLKKCVYPCLGGGRKKKIKIEGIGWTNDPQVILDTLRTAPEKIKYSDQMEFACVLTHDCALIPNNGLDIYEFNAADQEKLAAWRAKKDQLMAWIKERVDNRVGRDVYHDDVIDYMASL